MPAPLALIHEDVHPAPIKAEFQNITAALQPVLSGLGVWVSISDASLFSGSSLMTWTVEARDQTSLAYAMFGNTMLLNLSVDATTVGGTVSTALRMILPAGKTAKRDARATCQIFDNSAATSVLGQIMATAGSKLLNIARFDGANFTASTNLTYIRGQLFVEVI